jgi:hypothetical protein
VHGSGAHHARLGRSSARQVASSRVPQLIWRFTTVALRWRIAPISRVCHTGGSRATRVLRTPGVAVLAGGGARRPALLERE